MDTVADLSKKYKALLPQLQAIFPEWEESDLLFAIQDAKGNLEDTVLAISEGRASQFTEATKKKSAKTTSSKSRNDGGWEVTPDSFSGGRGGRGGGRGGRGGGRGVQAVRGARIGRGGARGGAAAGGRGGYANVNGGAKKSNGPPSDGWPTSTATTIEGWNSQVQQAETASAKDDDGGWGEPVEQHKDTEIKGDDGGWGEPAVEEPPKPTAAAVKPQGAWGGKKTAAAIVAGTAGSAPSAPKPARGPAPVPAQAPAAAAAPVPVAAPPVEPEKPAAPPAPATPAKKTWAQIAKPIEKPKPVPPPPAPKPESIPEPVPEPAVTEEEPEAVPVPVEEEVVAIEETVEEIPAPVEEPEAAPAPAEEIPAPAAQEAWTDPAIASSMPPQAAPEPVTTYTGPPGFNNVATKAVGGQQPQQQSRTNSRAAQRYKTAEGQGVVLPAQASSVSSVEMQFGSLSFGGANGDGVEAPAATEAPAQSEAAAPATSPARSTTQPLAPAQAPAAPVNQWQQPPQQPAGFPPSQTLQQQMHAYQSYGQQHQQQQQQQQQQPAAPQDSPAQQQQSHYGGYRQQDYYNHAIGSQQQQQPGQQAQPQQQQQQPEQQQAQPQSQQGQQPQPQQQQQGQPQQPQQQHSYDQGFGGFGGQSHYGQHQDQQNQYGQRGYDSFSNTGYPRPPADDKPATHTSAPQQPPHQQNQFYSGIGNMGYYGHSGPYNPYYQYGHAPNPGFQQYYPMAAGRQVYGQPAPQPPAPIPSNKPTPPAAHHGYGAPQGYPSSSGFEDQSFGLGRYGESNKGNAPQAQQGQQNPQPIGVGAGSLPGQSYPSQQGLHNFLGSSGGNQPNRPQSGAPEDSFKGAGGNASANAPAGIARQPSQPQQQSFSYPYGYQNHEWSPYGQQQQHYGSRNGGYSGWQQ